jgi:hypothetical protein
MAQPYQQIRSQESSTGATIKSANRRSLVQTTSQTNVLPGLFPIFVFLPNPEGPINGDPNAWPVRELRRYRFKASCRVNPLGGESVISLESASLQITFPGLPPAQQTGYGTAARLSSTTALAAEQLISIDDFVIDGSDMLALIARTPNSLSVPVFQVAIQVVANNTGVASWFVQLNAVWDYNQADFNSYRFDKWE